MQGIPNPEFGYGWVAACALRRSLLSGDQLQPRQAGSVRLQPGEVLYADIQLRHESWYGMNVTYQSSIRAFGGPLLLGATLAASAISNANRKAQAQRLAAQQWRFHGDNATLVTNHRILSFADNQWVSWYHGAAVELCPAPREYSLVALYEATNPLRLSGAGAPLMGVILGYLLYGPDFLAQHSEYDCLGDVPARQTEGL